MLKLKILFLSLFLFLITSCSKEPLKKSIIKEKSLELQVEEAYKDGMEALNNGDVLFAAKKFNEAEILFPQADSAPQSALMAAYSYYTQDYYGDSIAELKRFLKVYPTHKDLGYVYYLLAICYYEQIVDEKKDLQSIINAKETFNIILKNYPNTEYAIDAEFKVDLIDDILAAKEMYLGRYYFERKKWIPAISRLKIIVNKYDKTIFIEEALHRLVEIHYHLGLENESKKYAKILGYNYNSSEWFKQSYKVLNKNYQIKEDKKKTEKNLSEKSFLKKIVEIIK